MPLKRILAAVLALALALPGAALAQSAGDEQYVDPFDESEGQQQEATPPSQESESQGAGQGGDGTAAAPAETQVAPEVPTTTAPTTATPTAEGSEKLPVTGLPAAALALAGVLLLAAGAMLLRRA
jgi:hypothetical protein